MYGIYANIGGILMVNVSIYGIHGSYGIGINYHSLSSRIAGCFPLKPGTATSRGALTPAAGDLSRGEGIFDDPELEDGQKGWD